MPYFRLLEGHAGPVVTMEGKERIQLGSNNYLGLTGDERVKQAARDALEQLRHRADRLALPERHDPAAPRARARDRRLDGHRRRARLHGRLPGERRLHRDPARPRRHGDLRLRRPRVDPRRRDDVAGPDPALPPQPAWTSSRRMLERAAGDGGGVLVVVDGVFSMEGDVAPLPEIVELCAKHGARLMVDEAHGVGVLGRARRRARARRSASRTASTCAWAPSRSRSPAAAASSPGPADVIDFLRIQSRAFMFTASAVPAAVGAALGALRIIRSDEGPELFARVLDNARYLRDGLKQLGYETIDSDPGHADHPGADRRRLAGRPAVARPLRRRRLRERRDPPGGAARRRAAAHERDGDARARAPRPRARDVREGEAARVSRKPITA